MAAGGTTPRPLAGAPARTSSVLRSCRNICLGQVPLKDRAVSLAFIKELVRSLQAVRPRDFERLNSYMITGSKNLECRCDADAVPNIGKCEHAWKSAEDPTICHDWQFRALTARSTNLSIVETCIIAAELTGDRSFVEDGEGRPFFGTVTTFISYFWQAPFASLAAAIERCHIVGQKSANAKYWLDIFACSQNRHTTEAAERNAEDVGAFAKAIGDSRAVVWLWCEPWYAPGTLKRVWCLDELCAGIDLNYPERGFEMMLSAHEERDMRATLAKRFDAVVGSLTKIDVRNARATHEEDRVLVLGKIESRPGGFEGFSAAISDAMRGWLVATARKALGGRTDAELQGEPRLTRLLARWPALPERLSALGLLLFTGGVVVFIIWIERVDRSSSKREANIQLVVCVTLLLAGLGLCVACSAMSKQRAVRLGAVRPVGKARLSQLVRHTIVGVICNFLLPLSVAFGPLFMRWAGCTDKICFVYGVIAALGPIMPGVLVVLALNDHYIKEQAAFVLKVAKLASRQSGGLEEAKLLLDELLALCQDYGMVEQALCAHEEMAALHSRAEQAAEAERHEFAAHKLLDRYGRGWRWLVHMFVKSDSQWSFFGLITGTTHGFTRQSSTHSPRPACTRPLGT